MPEILQHPDPDRRISPKFWTLERGSSIFRVFRRGTYNPAPFTFRRFGPKHRFDHHDIPANSSKLADHDPDHGICYGAPTFSCCIVEVFGDFWDVDRSQHDVAIGTLSVDLILLDLRGKAALHAGTIAGINGVCPRIETQRWARHFYGHNSFNSCAGLIYSSSHSGEDAFAFFERAEVNFAYSASGRFELNDPALNGTIQQIALDCNLTVSP